MKQKIKIILFLIIILLVVLFLTNLFVKKDTIDIGVMTVLSGKAANIGLPTKEAIILAQNEINNNGGINGRELNLIIEDDKCNASDGITAINKLVNINQVKIVLGAGCSSGTISSGPIAEKNKVILLVTGAASPNITYLGDYVFRVLSSSADRGKILAEDAVSKKYVIAIIYESTDYTKPTIDVFKNRFNELKGTILLEEALSGEDDYKSSVIKIVSSKPDAILIMTQTTQNLSKILTILEQFNYSSQIYGNEQIGSEEILSKHKNYLEGAIFSDSKLDENSVLFQKFIKEFNKVYTDKLPASIIFFAGGYDAVYILKEAIEYCQSEKDTECIKNYLYSIKDRDGAAGKLTIDQNGDSIEKAVLKIIRNGKVEELN
ncbi:MAG: ABC transporter substrate-binding protein [archaeon]